MYYKCTNFSKFFEQLLKLFLLLFPHVYNLQFHSAFPPYFSLTSRHYGVVNWKLGPGDLVTEMFGVGLFYFALS